MFLVPLTPNASQSLSFNVDNAYWTVRIYQAATLICADISVNGNNLVTGTPCSVGQGILPYAYMSNPPANSSNDPEFGNFVFDAVPDWTQFGTACNLWYLERSEFQQLQKSVLLGG